MIQFKENTRSYNDKSIFIFIKNYNSDSLLLHKAAKSDINMSSFKN